MNFFKRAFTSLARSPIKSVILFFLIFILGTLVSGAVSVRNTIHTTDLNLRRNMRPVVVLAENWETIDVSWENESQFSDFLSLDVLYEVGRLPYVEYFDYSMRSWMASPDLDIWQPGEQEIFYDPDVGYTFSLRGVSHSDFMDIRQGFVEMVEGVSFTEAQLASGEPVAVISNYFAVHNELTIGDIISLNIKRHVANEEREFFFELYTTHEFEIIGLFGVVGLEDIEFDQMSNKTISEERMLNTANQIYLPNNIVREVNGIVQYQSARFDESQGLEIDWDTWDYPDLINPIFILNDPLYLDDFRYAAQYLLRDAWHLSDGLYLFVPISNSMNMLREIADGLLLGASISALTILGLVITLFLHDRRHEVGIYLALGEKRGKIVSQILTEVFILAVIAISTSLLAGTFIANHLSNELLQNEIADIVTPRREVDGLEILEPWELMGFPPPMSGEEMLEFYDFSITGTTIILFYTISLTIVILSVIIPIVYLTRLNPKKVLLS